MSPFYIIKSSPETGVGGLMVCAADANDALRKYDDLCGLRGRTLEISDAAGNEVSREDLRSILAVGGTAATRPSSLHEKSSA